MEIAVPALVWGVLFIFFLTPFNDQSNAKGSLRGALKASLIHITLHKKAVLALFLFVLTLMSIWLSFKDLQWYNAAHGVLSAENPAEQTRFYMVGTAVYALSLYVFLIAKNAVKLLKVK